MEGKEPPLDPEELADDLYFSRAWVELDTLLPPEGEPFEFHYNEGGEWFLERSTKCPIRSVGNERVERSLFDLQSPYGFSGPLTNSTDPAFIDRAFHSFRERAQDEGIVASFIRFHPFNPFPYRFHNKLDLCAHERNVVHIPFEGGTEGVFSAFRSSLRRNIRKALRSEMSFVDSDKGAKDREAFRSLYERTMRRIDAPASYFFSKEYFDQLFDSPFTHLFLVHAGEEPINGLVLVDGGEILYYHLGGTHEAYYSWNANPFNFHHAIRWGIEKGYKGLCMGGGNSIDEEDPLFKFKRKFSSDVWPFYIGGRILDKDRYNELIEMREAQQEETLPRFLKYRF